MHAMKNNPRGNRHTLLNRLPPELKRLPPVTPRTIGPEVTPEQVAIPAGIVTLGRSRTDTHGFGWDNEYEAQPVEVSVFAIDRYPVSNGEYLEFMVAGGYEEPAFWTERDWEWRTTQDINHTAACLLRRSFRNWFQPHYPYVYAGFRCVTR